MIDHAHGAIRIAMIDYGLSNLQSVSNAFVHAGCTIEIVRDAKNISDFDVLVLPGVGAFGPAIRAIHERGFFDPLRRHAVDEEKILFGICLGMQLLASESFENGEHQGLDIVKGVVRRLPADQPGTRIPNMGWQVTTADKKSPFSQGLNSHSSFYFANSYYFDCAENADCALRFKFGSCDITAGIQHGNVMGVQFHPEKSQDAGLNLLRSFINFAAGKSDR